MNHSKASSRAITILGFSALIIMTACSFAFAADGDDTPALYGTIWSILPPIVAIALALITKEVYSSLFIGILVGAVLTAGLSIPGILTVAINDGIIAGLTDSWNVGILIFLVVLGILAVLMNKSGGSNAFGRWAATKVKTRKGAQYATVALGALIFMDDYFNCLTVGSVMRPVTDKFNVSRAKLAYLIDATAAPVCILAPISSWAAAVTGFIEGEDGFQIFIQAIPYDFYAILTILMMLALIHMDFDYGKMAVYERNAKENGDLYTIRDEAAIRATEEELENAPEGRISDLVIPMLIMIFCCILGMMYTGGFFEGETFVRSFANCDAALSLALGSVGALILIIAYYCIRKSLTFRATMDAVPEGFKAMVSPILVLIFAWALKNVMTGLGLSTFIATVIDGLGDGVAGLLPAIFFLVSSGVAIASGTSWGTYGIIIPLALAVAEVRPDMLVLLVAACLAGGICGDHCSPISDTTIMSSAGSGSNHVSHVETQLPYALTVLCISTISFIVAGYTSGPWIGLIVGAILLILTLVFLKKRQEGKIAAEQNASE